MARKKKRAAGGLREGLGRVIEKLNTLVEQGGEIHEAIESQFEGEAFRGILGIRIKAAATAMNGAADRDGDGRAVAARAAPAKAGCDGRDGAEPIVTVTEEPDRIRVVAAVPGGGQDYMVVEVRDAFLMIEAARGMQAFRKQVPLPEGTEVGRLSCSCRNGLFEVLLRR